MDTPFKIGIYILLFIPGFVLVQTKDHHLLREKKQQFEKTLEIILWSALIWFFAFILPFWFPCDNYRQEVILALKNVASQNGNLDSLSQKILNTGKSSAVFYIFVCIWAFVAAHIWGLFRKLKYVDIIITYLTGRDWYPSVAFRFFKENLRKAVEVRVGEVKYIGVLYSAPDNKEDEHIIITDPWVVYKDENNKFKTEKLESVSKVVIKFNDISEIKSFKNEILIKKDPKNGRREKNTS